MADPADSANSANSANSADLLRAMLDPADGPLETVETHVSTVVFQNGWAYKLKRPVHYEFADLSTREKRAENCRRELEQNRRFAPDVYDSLIELCDQAGEVVDTVLKMRRMPADRRLSTLLRSPDPVDVVRGEEALRSVARQMAAAHSVAPRGSEIDAVASASALADLWLRSIDDMRTNVPAVFDAAALDDIQDRMQRYIGGRGALFADRIAEAMIVDGHGDLLCDDIFCLDDGPRILDCLEFDDRLRYGDVLLDIGFLAMDVERVGRPDLAQRLLAWYAEYSGEHHPASLLHHYIAYRALVRSKIAAIRSSEVPEAADEAGALLALCRSHLLCGEVVLAVVGGLPGAGKSTIASAIGEARGWATIVADIVRKEITGAGAAPAPAEFGAGIYTAERSEATYRTMLERARIALEHGESVVLDASFIDERWRAEARTVAAETHSLLVELRCETSQALRERRIGERRHDASQPSDATVAIATRMAAMQDPWEGAIVIDTTGEPGEAAADALGRIANAIGPGHRAAR